LVVRFISQQLTYPVPESLCQMVCEFAAEYHNTKEKVKLDPHSQEKLERIAEELGLLKPKPTGPYQSKSGRLYRRYLDRKNGLLPLQPTDIRPEDRFEQFIKKTQLCEDRIRDF